MRLLPGTRKPEVGEAKPQRWEEPADHSAVQTAQLRQFLGWLILAFLSFGLLQGVAFAVFRDVGSGVTGATLFTYGSFLLVARVMVGRGRQRIAIAIVYSGFLIAALIVVAAQPNLISVIILAPLLAMGVALPYASDRALRYLITTSWLATVAVVVLSEAFAPRSALPPWYDTGFRIAATATAVAVVLFLLWQFRSRLLATLAQVQAAEQQMRHDAYHDVLTGLPNRALLVERLARTVERAGKDKGYSFAVIFLDLDRFKNVNDSLGHATGDLLLIEVAHRLRSRVHPTDTVARLGGDEFAILLEDLADAEDATGVAERILEELGAPFRLEGYELFSTASLGIVVRPAGYKRPEDLLRDADTAMYHAKNGGGARHAVFDATMRARVVSLLRLETELRRAVEHQEFTVHYQPIVWLKSGRIVGFEALARWQHPERGLVPPAEFIPFAEETGLIVPIELFVLREACSRMSLWRAKFPECRPLSINVNLSATQIARPTLVEQIDRILRETGLDGRSLRLEITEGWIMQDTDLAADVLSRLRASGIRVHIDDFGTGYSSLSLLPSLPIDALKIDRSFVDGMTADGKSMEIIQTVTTLAHSLRMDVIAEGVETTEQLEHLRLVGCDYAQGHRFSRPVDARMVEKVIAAQPQW